jgi:acylaminoacyl-peptidase
VVFSARVAGREEPWSTNFDLYEAPSDGGAAPRNLTADNKAWDTQPVFLKNGDLAWLAMKRAGFEADRFAIRLAARRLGARSRPRNGIALFIHLDVARDGKTLLATANDVGQTPLFSVDTASGHATNLSDLGTVAEFTSAASGNVIVWHDLGTRLIST